MRVMPRGYSHDVRGDGTTVVKRYGGPLASRRAATERDTLLRLADSGLPVPRVLDSSPLVLITAHLPGVHGQEMIENGHAADVLRSCGETSDAFHRPWCTATTVPTTPFTTLPRTR
ncbi:phosphotransferase [Actinoplanes sp. NPDC089786]|uniref:phosphotransferase n=1 Tax=Actinoplanes sp. NPDC089786 TaxID=3155185 RepID=UPI0034416E2C